MQEKKAMAPRQNTKSDSEESSLRLAVLIDADNAQAAVIEGLLAEVARFGEATVKRIYGDFTSNHSASWKKVLQKFAIKPVQQFAYTTGKNATDSTLIIDAMDLLYTRGFDGFCLVTSDSDFTGLAMRIREEGLTVFGFGEQKTPEAFKNACHKFTFTENLRTVSSEETSSEIKKEKPKSEDAKPKLSKARKAAGGKSKLPRKFMLDALEHTVDDNGWANLSAFGSYLNKLQPEFDSRNYGFKKLSDLVKNHAELFSTEERASPSGKKQLYVRVK
jgi:hypothetical protein